MIFGGSSMRCLVIIVRPDEIINSGEKTTKFSRAGQSLLRFEGPIHEGK
jgi:hypothetical protein